MRKSEFREISVLTGKVFKLSESAEEVATFYAKMLEHDYTTKDVFNSNFLKDWRKVTSCYFLGCY